MTTTTIAGIPVTNCDGLFAAICALKGTHGISFRRMAKLADFRGMPAGTICAVYHGLELPNKWREVFGFPIMAPAPVCPIHHVVHVRATCPGNSPRRVRWVRVMGHQGYQEVKG